MDIGDPNEIPATRKKLPSMQELGAFDFGEPPARPETAPPAAAARGDIRSAPVGAAALAANAAPRRAAPARPVASPPAPTRPADLDTTPAGLQAARSSPAPATPRVPPTSEQLRQALAKADPQTRQKLMRLIAGGRTVRQVGPAAPDGPRRRNLVMQLDAEAPRTRSAATPSPGPAVRPLPPPPPASGFGAFSAAGAPRAQASPSPAPGFARTGASASPRPAPRAAEPALMQIDEHTELLDAVAPGPAPDARKADLQAQLAQAQRQAAAPEPARSEPLAHKVLFPAYDPSRHGDDVHGATRRRHEGPIEGHFPAPRQPFKPIYQHPDGRPMTAEETQVEEVLQTQRCEETLSVLARDGVNGLLLSPRDLDAAVANGVLSAETAATLWKTWSALRPVIHVIEDEPPPPTDAAGTEVADESGVAASAGRAAEEAPSEGLDTAADGVAEPMPLAASTRADPAGEAGAPARPAEAAGQPVGLPTDEPHGTAVEATATASATSAAAAVRTASPAPAPATAPGGFPPAMAPAKAASVSAQSTATGPLQPTPPGPEPESPTLPLPRATLSSQTVPAPAATAATVPDVPATASAIAPMAPTAAPTPTLTPAGSRRTRLKTLARGLFWAFVAYCVLATSARLAQLAWARWGHLFMT